MKKWIAAAALAIAVTLLAVASSPPSAPQPSIVGHSPITCRTLPGGGAACGQDVSVHTP